MQLGDSQEDEEVPHADFGHVKVGCVNSPRLKVTSV